MFITYTTNSDFLNLEDIRQAANLFLQDFSWDTPPQLEIAVHFVSDQKTLSSYKRRIIPAPLFARSLLISLKL